MAVAGALFALDELIADGRSISHAHLHLHETILIVVPNVLSVAGFYEVIMRAHRMSAHLNFVFAAIDDGHRHDAAILRIKTDIPIERWRIPQRDRQCGAG